MGLNMAAPPSATIPHHGEEPNSLRLTPLFLTMYKKQVVIKCPQGDAQLRVCFFKATHVLVSFPANDSLSETVKVRYHLVKTGSPVYERPGTVLETVQNHVYALLNLAS